MIGFSASNAFINLGLYFLCEIGLFIYLFLMLWWQEMVKTQVCRHAKGLQ